MKPSTLIRLTFMSILAWTVIWLVSCAVCRADDRIDTVGLGTVKVEKNDPPVVDHRYDYPVSVKAVDTTYVTIPPDSLSLLNPATPVYYRDGKPALMVLRAKEFNWKPKKVVQIAGRFALTPTEMDELTKYLTEKIVADSLKKPLDSTLRFK